MDDADLISAIQQNSELDDPDEVERAAHATLTVLGLQLAAGEPLDLGGRRPTSRGPSLAVVGEGERFSLKDFYDHVGQLEGTEPDDARRHARAVMAGIKAAVEPYEWESMLVQLPAEYSDLVFTDPVH